MGKGTREGLCTRPWGYSTPVQVLDVEKDRKPEQETGQTRKSRGKVVPITPIKKFKRGFRARENMVLPPFKSS